MTRERAAELLSEVTVLDDPEMAEAHRVAISALRQQDHFREVTKKLEPLTMDELVELGVMAENGENVSVYCTPRNDWAKVFKFGLLFFGTEEYRSWPEIEDDYGKTWLAYRQKPEEGTD